MKNNNPWPFPTEAGDSFFNPGETTADTKMNTFDWNKAASYVKSWKEDIDVIQKMPVLDGYGGTDIDTTDWGKISEYLRKHGKTRERQIVVETDPSGITPATPGAKLDAGKIRPWLCIAGFSHALEEVSRVTTKGAEKYTPNGWAEVPNGAERYMEAFGRHLISYGRGEVFDNGPKGLGPDIYHKAQMIWNLLASLELELREKNGQ